MRHGVRYPLRHLTAQGELFNPLISDNMLKYYDEEEEHERATKALLRLARRNGWQPVYPSKGLTEVTWKYVYLYNHDGLIAKYNRRTRKIVA